MPVNSYPLDHGTLESSLPDLCLARGVELQVARLAMKITAGSRGGRHELLVRDDKGESC